MSRVGAPGPMTRLKALLTGREPVPEGFTGTLDAEERVLADARGPRGSIVLATDLGLWLPPVAAGAPSRRLDWHLISKATWGSGALEVVAAADADDLGGGVVLITDAPPQRVPLPETGRVPDVVHRRVTDAIHSRQHHEIGDGGAWFVQRRVPGTGVVVHVRPDPGTDSTAVRTVAVGLAEKLRAARG